MTRGKADDTTYNAAYEAAYKAAFQASCDAFKISCNTARGALNVIANSKRWSAEHATANELVGPGKTYKAIERPEYRHDHVPVWYCVSFFFVFINICCYWAASALLLVLIRLWP